MPVNNGFGFFTTPALSADTNDIQTFIKMVDARLFDGHYWVFLGGLRVVWWLCFIAVLPCESYSPGEVGDVSGRRCDRV